MTDKEWRDLMKYIEWYISYYVKRNTAFKTDLEYLAVCTIDNKDDFNNAKRKAHNAMRAKIKRKKYNKNENTIYLNKNPIANCVMCGANIFRKGQKTCSGRCRTAAFRKM